MDLEQSRGGRGMTLYGHVRVHGERAVVSRQGSIGLIYPRSVGRPEEAGNDFGKRRCQIS